MSCYHTYYFRLHVMVVDDVGVWSDIPIDPTPFEFLAKNDKIAIEHTQKFFPDWVFAGKEWKENIEVQYDDSNRVFYYLSNNEVGISVRLYREDSFLPYFNSEFLWELVSKHLEDAGIDVVHNQEPYDILAHLNELHGDRGDI